MAKSTKKKQQAALKKRRKDKARRKQQANTLTLPNPRTLIKGARKFPILQCWISSGWDDEEQSGLVQVLVAREQPDQGIVFAKYLIDIFCLGLKDAMCNAGIPRSEFRQMLGQLFIGTEVEACSPELAHQMVYESIAYAAQFGFKPHSDFKLAKNLLEPQGSLDTPYKLTFGKDGKPFFINGPYDDVDAILAKLDKNPGQGNYHSMMQSGDFDILEFDEE
jgi:hypothetical protein